MEVAKLPWGSHRSMWKSLRMLQWAKVSLRPVRTKTIKKANGDFCEC